MIEIVLTEIHVASLKDGLLATDDERCATLVARVHRRNDGVTRLLVHHIDWPAETEYEYSSPFEAQLTGGYVANIVKRAKADDEALIFVHTHPGSEAPRFSLIDDAGEQHLKAFLDNRGCKLPHCALVISRGGMEARLLGTNQFVDVVSIGQQRRVLFSQTNALGKIAQRYDRHVRAFGQAGQRQLQSLHVGIVGLGGTGSILVQQLVHLGVHRFTLIDPDVVDETNLNRVVGASANDVGELKIEVAKRQLLHHNPDVKLTTIAGNVVHQRVAQSLLEADFLFSCTDSHGSRSVIQQIAYQYLLPCIDMGSIIAMGEDNIHSILGRAQLLSPGEPCLWCSKLLDSEQIRRDLLTDVERKLDPYIPGANEVAPSVIWLNGIVVSLAVGMFMGVVAGADMPGRHWHYHAHRTALRRIESARNPNCFICSAAGVLAKGPKQQLFARTD